MKHRLKHRGSHVVDPHVTRGRLPHGAPEDRRPHGEHDLVLLELALLHLERHAGSLPALEELQQVIGHVGRRHGDGAVDHLCGCSGGARALEDLDGAAYREFVTRSSLEARIYFDPKE